MPTILPSVVWKVEALECKPKEGAFENVVTVVHWRATVSQGDVSETNYGAINIRSDIGGSFVEYDNLNESTVIAWVKQTLTTAKVNEIEAALQSQLQQKLTPVVVRPPLPWAS